MKTIEQLTQEISELHGRNFRDVYDALKKTDLALAKDYANLIRHILVREGHKKTHLGTLLQLEKLNSNRERLIEDEVSIRTLSQTIESTLSTKPEGEMGKLVDRITKFKEEGDFNASKPKKRKTKVKISPQRYEGIILPMTFDGLLGGSPACKEHFNVIISQFVMQEVVGDLSNLDLSIIERVLEDCGGDLSLRQVEFLLYLRAVKEVPSGTYPIYHDNEYNLQEFTPWVKVPKSLERFLGDKVPEDTALREIYLTFFTTGLLSALNYRSVEYLNRYPCNLGDITFLSPREIATVIRSEGDVLDTLIITREINLEVANSFIVRKVIKDFDDLTKDLEHIRKFLTSMGVDKTGITLALSLGGLNALVISLYLCKVVSLPLLEQWFVSQGITGAEDGVHFKDMVKMIKPKPQKTVKNTKSTEES